MALPTDEAQGFGIYYRGLSTAGIFFRNHINDHYHLPNVYSLHQQFYPYPLLYPYGPFPPSFTVLSSSRGHILCRDTTSTLSYFIMFPNFVNVYLPIPQRHHCTSTPAVISFNFDESYNISCVIDEGDYTYSIDTYHSEFGWVTRVCYFDINPVRGIICLNSGVAVRRCAYWLTDGPWQTCIMFDPDYGTVEYKNEHFPRVRNLFNANSQLGRIEDDICMVVINNPYGEFYILEDNWRWVRLRRVKLVDDEEENDEVVPLRFESYKFEFVYCVRGARLGMVESSDLTGELRVVPLLYSEQMLAADGYDIGNAVPFAP